MTATIVAVMLLLLTVPAFAEHNTFETTREPVDLAGPRESTATRESRDLDIEVKVGRDHVRLGGRLFGPNGVAGAWLNGRLRPWGLSLDGRIQQERRAFNFKLDADLD